jgi:hypothetical protein
VILIFKCQKDIIYLGKPYVVPVCSYVSSKGHIEIMASEFLLTLHNKLMEFEMLSVSPYDCFPIVIVYY